MVAFVRGRRILYLVKICTKIGAILDEGRRYYEGLRGIVL